MIVLDFGSGETAQNDVETAYRMIDELAAIDTRRENVIIKWQLEKDTPYIESAGRKVEPLKHGVFTLAYTHAYWKQYWTTASVFDEESLEFLLQFNVPFIKIANKPEKYYLLDKIPKDKKVMVSIGPGFKKDELIKQYPNVIPLHCISEYPADPTVYETSWGRALSYSISDHTSDFYLYHKYRPWYLEKHYKLDDSEGLDNGPWAVTPEMLKEIL
jgi:sialic acid synthase SpsE